MSWSEFFGAFAGAFCGCMTLAMVAGISFVRVSRQMNRDKDTGP